MLFRSVEVVAALQFDPGYLFDLVTMVEEIAGIKLKRSYDLNAPKGVAGRNSDNTMIQRILGWEPKTPLRTGMEKTYAWIARQFADRKAGKRVVKD